MSDVTRPRPRPKPKQKAKPSDVTPEPGPSSSAKLTSSPLKKKVSDVQNDDEVFMRNRKRTNKDWEHLERLNKVTKIIHMDSDSDEEVASPRRRRHQKKEEMPAWQREKNIARLLSADLSENSDDEIQIVGESTTPSKKHTAKRKRERSRSRSITPPPALPLHQLQKAREVVRQALDIAPRPASPTHEADLSTDTVFANPELDRIAKSVASRVQLFPAPPPVPPEIVGTVILSVHWQPHPLNEAGKKDVWVFKINRDDNFHDLFEATAEEASILTENLIMSYRGKRIFSSVTPITLKIWEEDELVACDKATYEYLRKHPLTAAESFSTLDPTMQTEIPPDTDAASPPQASDAESDSDGDTFKLVVQSAIAKGITLTVRPTTKCGAIVKAFLKRAGVADNYPAVFGATVGKKKGGKDPKLRVDGDKMENEAEIGEADLEDGDQVEIVGL